MKRPTWATITGVLAIIFGISGIFGGGQEMAAPTVMEMQTEVIELISKKKPIPEVGINIEITADDEESDMPHVFEILEEQFKYPEWYKSWAVVIGTISMFVATLYLCSGIFLLMTKQYAVQFFYMAIAASVTWAVLLATVYSFSGSGILIAQIPMAIASVVIDLVLITVAFFGSKEQRIDRREATVETA